MSSTYEIKNKHELYNAKYEDIEKYRNQALIGTINLSIGILITGIMIIKNRYIG